MIPFPRVHQERYRRLQTSLRELLISESPIQGTPALQGFLTNRALEVTAVWPLKKLNEFDIGEDRIQTRTVTGLANIGAAILKEVQTGNYDTVVMGRSGVNKSFFTGSVTSTVLNKISKGAVWLVP